MMRFILALLVLTLLPIPGCAREKAREPAVAGAFYPRDPQSLRTAVTGYLAAAGTVAAGEGRLMTLLVPHAGYVYSGATAAKAYARLQGKDIRTVILVGPSHQAAVHGAVVYPGGAWQTPLGRVPIDATRAASLISASNQVTANPAAFAAEHSLEVQLPFLQQVLKDFTIVPVLIGQPTRESYRHLADRIALLLKQDERTLLVISTDLSHYLDRAAAEQKDRPALDALQRLALGDFERLITSGKSELCGEWAVLYGLAAARGAGVTLGELFAYADSGAASGDTKRVVGYAAMGFYRRQLSAAARSELLNLARTTVVSTVNGQPLPSWRGADAQLAADGAAFVTLKQKDGALRGCIGHIQPRGSLASSVIQNAVAASTHDPRFPPVRPAELANLDLEVTVLSPMEPLPDPAGIVIGQDGLYLEAGHRSSVFLPQVPVEQGWDRATYLAELALKAGLPADGWKSGKLYRFTAEIIH
jgi:AmmeMemoRadiSam system protein B/AmmeMemoRadiSam system protein A